MCTGLIPALGTDVLSLKAVRGFSQTRRRRHSEQSLVSGRGGLVVQDMQIVLTFPQPFRVLAMGI